MYDICVEDFMVRDVKYIWNRMTFQQLKDILKENKVFNNYKIDSLAPVTVNNVPLIVNPVNKCY